MLEARTILTEMKNASHRLTSRRSAAEDRIGNVKVGQQKIPQLKDKEEK